eukprot:g5380.t1
MDHLQAPATDQLVHQLAKAPQLLGQPPPADESKAKQAGFFSESLESLAYRHDSDDEVNPEAPSGSFRQKDLAREASGTGSQAVGLDGKVYSFIEAPSDDESSAERNAPSAVKDKGKSKKKVKKDSRE